jgi:hypothetical protein
MKNAPVPRTGPRTGRIFGRALPPAVFALALAVGSAAGAQEDGSAGSDISYSNQLQIWVVDSTRAASYLDAFDIQGTHGPWLIQARFELDEEDRTDPQRSLGIVRRFAEYHDETATLRGGTYYASFGRGLLLRAEEDATVRLDRDIDGFYGALHWKALDGQLLVGRPRNDKTYQRDDLIAGSELTVRATPELSLGGGYVRRDAAMGLGAGNASVDSSLGRPVEELAGGHARWTHGLAEAYVEYAKRYVWGRYDPALGWIGLSARDGRAVYGSLTLGVPGYTALIEGKDYLGFDAPYSTLPPANAAGMPTNNGRDDRGFGISFTASPREDFTLDAAASHADARDDDGWRSSAEGRVRKDWWGRGSLQVGGEWNEEIGMTEVTGFPYRKYAGPGLNASYYFGAERTLALHSKLLAREDREPYVKYTEVSADLTFSLSPSQAITASLIRTTEPLPHYEHEDTWASLEYHWTITVQHEVKIKAGRERGGIVCSGGVCHYEPPFSGVRIEFLSRL